MAKKTRLSDADEYEFSPNSGTPLMSNNSAETSKGISSAANSTIKLEFTGENVLRGIIYSEILGPPVCRRKWQKRI